MRGNCCWTWCVLGIGLVVIGTMTPARADDMDGDGVDDAIDVCNNTPPGVAVDAEGRPLGDLDGDCDVDVDDFALFQQGMTGPLAPVGACCYADGSCTVLMEADCSGTWQGAGTQCTPNLCLPSGMVMVPAGEFQMGDPFGEGAPDERPVHAVYLDTYWVDQFEVTNAEYVVALNWAYAQDGLIEVRNDSYVYKAGDTEKYFECIPGNYDSRIEFDGNTFTITAGYDDFPVATLTWYGAAAYCNWRSAMQGRTPAYNLDDWSCDFASDGYRLPTEAEWEKAAAWDPDQSRHFRFGEGTDGCGFDCLDGHRATYLDNGGPYNTALTPYTPVGFYNGELHQKADFDWPGDVETYQTQDARSYYGCYDMTGNVWEWCHDWYGDVYDSSPYENPTGPATGSTRVRRGGSWDRYVSNCRASARSTVNPDYAICGVRCVVRPPQ